MKFEIEFHDSRVEAVNVSENRVEIRLDEASLIVIDPEKGWLSEEEHRVPAAITLESPTFTSLPDTGTLFDGDVRGIPGREFEGVIPIDLEYPGLCELLLSDEAGDHSIKGRNLTITVDENSIPRHLRDQ